MVVERKLTRRQLTDDGRGVVGPFGRFAASLECIETEMTHLMSLGQKWVEAVLLSM
jgi:hypothetical protein